jgi:dTDP-4-amino-4,6-dideoxygalactose transaminase
VPVHVYGNVCDIEGFERLREKYGVKIIYDAAHAFGVMGGDGVTIGACGDMSMFSFHPTKLFHSCEGGLLVFRDESIQQKLFDLRNFAIHSETECIDVGTNAKMNELQALMGLLCLNKIDELLAWREKIHETYKAAFADCPTVKYLDYSQNRAYCPILFKDFETRERVYTELNEKCNVFTRRYFYPLLTDFAPYVYAKGTCPVAEDMAKRVLTLPTYYGLAIEKVKAIAENVKEIIG